MKLTAIAKSKTTELKGIAIFMMLFLHLFNQAENVDLCTTTGITVGGESLVLFLSHGMGPVSLYLFLSGYGLYYNHRNQNRGVISGGLSGYISFTGPPSCCSAASAACYALTYIPARLQTS